MVLVVVLAGSPADATYGDLYAAGTRYCASTYSPGHDTPRGFGSPLDLNAAGGDFGRPVLAPADGSVRVFSRGGIYGRSVVWRSVDGSERIHVAHLQRIIRTGPIRAGETIGLAGNSGNSFGEGHLHVARRLDGRPAPLELSGRAVAAGRCVVSSGPITARCGGATATIVGSRGPDRLVGTGGDDVVAARGGADVVMGRGGDDVVCGGGGRDALLGRGGSDSLDGGPGRDRLDGGADVDECVAGEDLAACEL
jgi:murein DD-endopeptidase MepM/ murein hydrolase activator NlpD